MMSFTRDLREFQKPMLFPAKIGMNKANITHRTNSEQPSFSNNVNTK